jgi:hypothetical protein
LAGDLHAADAEIAPPAGTPFSAVLDQIGRRGKSAVSIAAGLLKVIIL